MATTMDTEQVPSREAAPLIVCRGLTKTFKTADGQLPVLEKARETHGSGEKRTLRITAKYAQHWNFVGGPAEEFARKRDVLASHCADIGRDPKEIMLSAHIRLSDNHLEHGQPLDYGHAIEEAAALGKEGLDLAIVYLPTPHTPAVLEPLAEAIRDSGLLTSKDK